MLPNLIRPVCILVAVTAVAATVVLSDVVVAAPIYDSASAYILLVY
jgi:hypothetical protein